MSVTSPLLLMTAQLCNYWYKPAVMLHHDEPKNWPLNVKCHWNTSWVLHHKMALALCPRPAHLYVLKLSSELHGGGTGSVETAEVLRNALLLARLRPSNTPTNHNSRKKSQAPPTFDLTKCGRPCSHSCAVLDKILKTQDQTFLLRFLITHARICWVY